MGLLKMDFLGLTTLTILDDAAQANCAARRRQLTWTRFPWMTPKLTNAFSIVL